MSDLGTIHDPADFLELLGEKGKNIEVAWIEALMAAGCEISFHPFSKADIQAARCGDVKPLFPIDPLQRKAR